MQYKAFLAFADKLLCSLLDNTPRNEFAFGIRFDLADFSFYHRHLWIQVIVATAVDRGLAFAATGEHGHLVDPGHAVQRSPRSADRVTAVACF
jgi:hypothetical protein